MNRSLRCTASFLNGGLDSAFTFLRDKDPKILVEAVKTRNALAVKRFEYAWAACQELANFTMDCEEALQSFRAAQPDELKVKDYIKKLRNDFHPVHFTLDSNLHCPLCLPLEKSLHF